MHAATYYDGKSAEAHPVSVVAEGHQLAIQQISGPVLAMWPYTDIFAVNANYRSQPLRLGCDGFEDARLVITEAETEAYLRLHLPQALFKQGSLTKTLGAAAVFGILTVTVLAGLYYTIPLLAEPIAQRIPLETEQQIGDDMAASLLERWPQCEQGAGDEGWAALQQLTDLLTEGTLIQDRVNVSLVDSAIENAFALPGGYVMVTGPLIASMEGPEELAAVLAHEFGHVEHRHSMVALTRYMGTSFLVQLITGGGGGSSQWILIAGSELANISYSREFEREADQYAIDRLLETGIGTQGMVNFFERLAEQEAEDGGGFRPLQTFVRTHPFSDDRAQHAETFAQEGTHAAMTEEAWQAIKSICPLAIRKIRHHPVVRRAKNQQSKG